MITTHVLDVAHGRPAAGVQVVLEQADRGERWQEVGRGVTDAQGRLRTLTAEGIPPVAGVYRLVFDTGAYFAQHGARSFFPQVTVAFEVADAGDHYHVPLLLSPFGYSTYRGT